MHGRFGAYVQLGETPDAARSEKPRRASLGRDFSEDTITLADALKLLSLPRELGTADDGEADRRQRRPLRAVCEARDRVPLARADDDVYVISLERAKELLAQPKKSMRRQRAAPKELKALGKHPDSGEPVRILDGRYGPYVTDGTTNASLPEGAGARIADAWTRRAELLAARAGQLEAKGLARAQGRSARAQGRAGARTEERARADLMIHIVGGGWPGAKRPGRPRSAAST